MRKAIAHSVVSLDVAGEVCIAGDDHVFASGRFVGRAVQSVSLGHRFGQLMLNHWEQLLLS